MDKIFNSSNELLFLTEERMREHAEMLYFSYKGFTADPDKLLEQYGLGRAHHRVLYFIHQRPNLKITELLAILGITKQSLNRVLRRLIDDNYVEVHIGIIDRRERRLTLAPKGVELEAQLAKIQHERLKSAFMQAGPEAVKGFKLVLEQMVDEESYKVFNAIEGESECNIS